MKNYSSLESVSGDHGCMSAPSLDEWWAGEETTPTGRCKFCSVDDVSQRDDFIVGSVVSPQHLYAEVLTMVPQNANLSGERVFAGGKWGGESRLWSIMTGVLMKREIWTQKYIRGERIWRETGRRPPSKWQGERPRTHPSLTVPRRNNPAVTLTLYFLSRAVGQYLVKLLNVWFFVTAAYQTNRCIQ